MSPSRPRTEEQALLVNQLQAPDEAPELPYDVRWARRLLAGERPQTPEVLRQELIEALVRLLVERGQATLLGELSALPQKPLAKAARRGLHRLRSRGVAAELPAPQAHGQSGTGLLSRASEIPGLVTMYDPTLQRAVWLATSEVAGLAVYQARISAEHGLTDFSAWESSRRNYSALVRKIRGEFGAAAVDSAQARWFIQEAAARSQQAQRALPAAFVRARQALGAPQPGPHPALALVPAQASEQDLAALLELPELAFWLPDRELAQGLMLRIEEVMTSRLLLDDKQRQAQIQLAIERAVESHFVPPRNAAYRQLLLDTAHLLEVLGQTTAARLARAGAELFQLPAAQVMRQPLARRFIERVLRLPAPPAEAAPVAAGPAASSGLILPGLTGKG